MHEAAFQIRDVLSQDELAVLGIPIPSVQTCFAQVLRAVRQAIDMPIAFVHINNLRADSIAPSTSLCGLAMQAESILLIESLPTDARFKSHHYFDIAPELQFFCGLPLYDAGGNSVGVLCLIDRRPRHLGDEQIASLHNYAAWALAEWRAYQAHQSVQAAREADRRLSNVLENVQDAVFTVDALANITTVNPAAINMFAYDQSNLQSMNLASLITMSDANWRNNIAALAQSLSAWSNRAGVVEMLGVRSDKTEFFLELTVSVLQRAPAPSYTVIAREISERKRAEQKICESERLFKTVMDSTAFCVYVRDLEGRFLYVNREYEHVFHRDNRVDKGTLFTEVLNPELAHTVYQIEQTVIANRESIWAENLVQREDGEHVYLVIRSPLLDETGAVIGTCGVATDMTPIKKLEKNMAEAMEALRVSEERWSFALEASGDGVWDWDIVNNVVLLSKRGKALLGYEEHEIGNGMNEWDQRVHPDDKQQALASLQENLDGITDSFTNEHRVRCKDGHYIWLLDRGKVVQRDANGKALRVIGTHTDITQRKNLERIKSEFVSTVSHELRTPLTSIRGSLGLLEGGVLGTIPPKALALISVASKNCQRLITLVNDILDMDKLLSGKMNLDIISTDLNELILQSIEANAGYGSSYQVQFNFENNAPDARTPKFGQVDVNRFMQIMANLLSNAAKFSKPQSQVNIRLQANQHLWRIEVEDHGEGIPPDFQSRIFEAFAQADSANTRKQGSTGLGLNISKNLVEKMGGEIGFQTKLGLGTTFWFTVPAA